VPGVRQVGATGRSVRTGTRHGRLSSRRERSRPEGPRVGGGRDRPPARRPSDGAVCGGRSASTPAFERRRRPARDLRGGGAPTLPGRDRDPLSPPRARTSARARIRDERGGGDRDGALGRRAPPRPSTASGRSRPSRRLVRPRRPRGGRGDPRRRARGPSATRRPSVRGSGALPVPFADPRRSRHRADSVTGGPRALALAASDRGGRERVVRSGDTADPGGVLPRERTIYGPHGSRASATSVDPPRPATSRGFCRPGNVRRYLHRDAPKPGRSEGSGRVAPGSRCSDGRAPRRPSRGLRSARRAQHERSAARGTARGRTAAATLLARGPSRPRP
jgi:hypothetical protein